jgi:hypothetical protein
MDGRRNAVSTMMRATPVLGVERLTPVERHRIGPEQRSALFGGHRPPELLPNEKEVVLVGALRAALTSGPPG